MAGAATFTYYGPNAAQEGLDAAEKFNAPNAAATGQVPVAPPINTNAFAQPGNAIAAEQQAYNQLPGYNGSLAQIGQNIQSETAGQLPQDVIEQIQQGAAERGIGRGIAGSPNTGADYLQSLGLNSLELTQQGQQNFQSILPQLPGASIAANPNFYVTPEQQYQQALQAAIFQAAPQPGAASAAALNAARGGIAAGMGYAGSRGPSPGTGVAPTTIAQAPQGSNNLPMLNQMISDYDPANFEKSIGYEPTRYYHAHPTGVLTPDPPPETSNIYRLCRV